MVFHYPHDAISFDVGCFSWFIHILYVSQGSTQCHKQQISYHHEYKDRQNVLLYKFLERLFPTVNAVRYANYLYLHLSLT